MQTFKKTVFWDSTFFCHIWLAIFTTMSYEMSFQSCCKMWICRLEFIYGSCMMVLHHIFFFHFRNSWTTCFHNKGKSNMDLQQWPAHSPYLNPLDFYLWRHITSDVYATAVSVIQNLQQRAQNAFKMVCMTPGEFSSHSVTVQKCNILHWSWRWSLWAFFLNLQEATGWKQCFRRLMFINCFFFLVL